MLSGLSHSENELGRNGCADCEADLLLVDQVESLSGVKPPFENKYLAVGTARWDRSGTKKEKACYLSYQVKHFN